MAVDFDQKLVQKVRKFDQDFDLLVMLLARQFSDEIINWNAQQQLFKSGELSTGTKIVPRYAASTIKRKKKKGQPTNRVTLKDTGDFHRSFAIQFYDDRFEIVSSDEKVKYLTARYSDAILGLNDDHINKLRVAMLPLLRAEMLKLFL